MEIGYIRTSTAEQNEARQEVLMQELGVEQIFIDKMTGKTLDRPELQKMLSFVREGDIQAKKAFVNMLPNLSITNLCEDKANYNARAVFSTYQTMIHCIDNAKDEQGGKLYTVGHFDLIICDEAHRSIYNKYKDIFTYFDAHLVGLTATPRDEVDKDTYKIFELESGVPTYGYELDQAVEDKYLVPYETVETTLKLMEDGIVYDDLSDEDKEE